MQLIYKSSVLYDLVNLLLYGRHYHTRYQVIAQLIPPNASVVDLCCGPATLYHRFLRSKGVQYTGLDLSPHFVDRLQKGGGQGMIWDVGSTRPLPPADYVIIQGALYFFLPDPSPLIERMLAAANEAVIVAEAIRNLSTSAIPGFSALAKKLAGAVKDSGAVRLTEESLDRLFAGYAPAAKCTFKIPGGRDKVYVLRKAAGYRPVNPERLTRSTLAMPVGLEETYWWYRARKEIIGATVRRFLPAGSKIVDFGSGTGVIARYLVDLGYEVVAADICTHMLRACRERGLNVIDLNRDWPANASADCVLACDVLEHIEDDIGLLRKLKFALRAGGFLIATVPAYDFLWSGEDYISEHFRRYRKPQLQKRIEKAGLQIEWSSYFNSLLLPVVTAAVLYKRLFRPRDMYRSDIEPLPDWLNNVLYRIFAIERHLLPRFHFPAGASILLVACS
jgi:SAM-dependent methyltransferase